MSLENSHIQVLPLDNKGRAIQSHTGFYPALGDGTGSPVSVTSGAAVAFGMPGAAVHFSFCPDKDVYVSDVSDFRRSFLVKAGVWMNLPVIASKVVYMKAASDTAFVSFFCSVMDYI